ncbi:MAG: hypothetical protein HPY94_04700 [Clostridia bacterium]|nr:hypothetical protein [Clostridia bacterium]
MIDAENIFVENRNQPIYTVPEIGIGNKPIYDGCYFPEEEKKFLKNNLKTKNGLDLG